MDHVEQLVTLKTGKHRQRNPRTYAIDAEQRPEPRDIRPTRESVQGQRVLPDNLVCVQEHIATHTYVASPQDGSGYVRPVKDPVDIDHQGIRFDLRDAALEAGDHESSPGRSI